MHKFIQSRLENGKGLLQMELQQTLPYKEVTL